jgi:LPXTG-site transpeptidase (sortase) family protein
VIDSISPDPTAGGTSVTWHADEDGTFSLRVGASDCSNGDEVASGSYSTSPNTVVTNVASSSLADGTNTLRLCVYDQMGLLNAVTGTVVKDSTAPNIFSIMRQDPAANPTDATSVTFRVTFGEDMLVSTVDTADFILNHTGTAAGTLSAINSISDAVFDVVIIGVSGDGNLSLSVSTINNITDAIGNSLGSSPFIGTSQSYSIDNSVIAVLSTGVVGIPGSVTIQNNGTYHSNFTSILVTFDSDAADPAGNAGEDDVTNPNNFILLQPGTTGEFYTIDCTEIAADDTRIPTGPVVYNNNDGDGPFTATLTVNGGTPLPYGTYRLLICGTTSIVDLLGRPLNDGADEVIDFSITAEAATIPLTGFAQNRVTYLPEPEVTYADSDLWLEIPALGVEMDIVGIPQSADGTWDVSWLGEDAGWLAGTAYPTWDGNSVITGHVWNADNTPGPFNGLSNMRYGQQVILHANGAEYVYEVRSVDLVGPNSAASMLRHQNNPWITLVTCVGYNESTDSYRYRVLVRAVLVEVR